MERARRIFTLLTPGKSWERGLIAALALLLLTYLLLFLFLPVASLLVQGLRGSEGGLGLEFVGLFLANPLYAEGLLNSLLAGAGAALTPVVAQIVVEHVGQVEQRRGRDKDLQIVPCGGIQRAVRAPRAQQRQLQRPALHGVGWQRNVQGQSCASARDLPA